MFVDFFYISFYLVQVLVSLYLKKHGVMVHCPGKNLAALFTKLKPDLPEDAVAKLSEFQTLVMTFLTAPKDAPMDPVFLQKIPEVKQLVLG
jgi:hypothetical protein